MDDCYVAAVKELARGYVTAIALGQGILQLGKLGYQHQTCSVAVQAVYWMKIYVSLTYLTVMYSPVAKGIVVVATCWVYQDAGRLVKDNHGVILIADV